jgi:hypothetical protein
MVRELMGIGLVGALALAGAFGVACSSSSSGGNGGLENDAATVPDVDYLADASAWCYTDQTGNPSTIVDECDRNLGECPIGATPVATCPTANLAGCCKGTANSPSGTAGEVCIYTDSNLDLEGGAQDWCTCMPASSTCYGGTWQKSP